MSSSRNELLHPHCTSRVLDIPSGACFHRVVDSSETLPHMGGYTTNQRIQNKTNRKKSILLRQTRYQAQGKHYYFIIGKGKRIIRLYWVQTYSLVRCGLSLFGCCLELSQVGDSALELVPFLGGSTRATNRSSWASINPTAQGLWGGLRHCSDALHCSALHATAAAHPLPLHGSNRINSLAMRCDTHKDPSSPINDTLLHHSSTH
ncbi:hypothetical protein EDB82DRAFT_196030 [Fusarium venenatum]|uniref:uncharacterized protein n=1 Tax=Fusarium venenatum TaxID=56646 RepID=UPI001D335185|nr:hypothetical protein EDB82DRAFT_196030 [Fusarium venenatum]